MAQRDRSTSSVAPPEASFGVSIYGDEVPDQSEIFTDEAFKFVCFMERRFRPKRKAVQARRRELERRHAGGEQPDFDPATKAIRDGGWKIDPIPADLECRRVELFGPPDPLATVRGVNSGAQVFVGDLSACVSPSWRNIVGSQKVLRDAVHGDLVYDGVRGEEQVSQSPALVSLRPRSLHQFERNVWVDAERISAGLMDIVLFLVHNARTIVSQGRTVLVYLPDIYTADEAALYDEILCAAESLFGLERGTIRATVSVDNIATAFCLDEILHALRRHSAGLALGTWSYLYDWVRVFQKDPRRVLPDRDQVLALPFMRNVGTLIVETAHKHGAHAIGGLAAALPCEEETAAATMHLAEMADEKLREVFEGFDGTQVAHHRVVPRVAEIFEERMEGPNQIDRGMLPRNLGADELLAHKPKPITETGLRHNIRFGIQQLAAWLGGIGSVALEQTVETQASADVARAQVWHWLKHPTGVLVDGTEIEERFVKGVFKEELSALTDHTPDYLQEYGQFDLAGEVFLKYLTSKDVDNNPTRQVYGRL